MSFFDGEGAGWEAIRNPTAGDGVLRGSSGVVFALADFGAEAAEKDECVGEDGKGARQSKED